jgi:ethanolamine ammonia-lyase small subunit
MTETSWPVLRRATPARIGLRRAGVALTTASQLEFQVAHARARDAVHATLDAERILVELRGLGLQTVHLHSQAADRATYLRRPDLGRRLDDASRVRLQALRPAPSEIAFVIADGLSATAVNAHAVALLKTVLPEFARLTIGPATVVEGGRVAIGDEIGALLETELVAVLIGERPGLSAADSLGIYLTWQPAPGAIDAARNCLSNIRPEGMPLAEAGATLVGLIANARRYRMTGVALSRRLGSEPANAIDSCY